MNKNSKNCPEVVIDGIRYVPAKHIIANRDQILQMLVEEYMGRTPTENIEKLSKELWVLVTEEPNMYEDLPTIQELVERMAL